jgi:hypothetical protein
MHAYVVCLVIDCNAIEPYKLREAQFPRLKRVCEQLERPIQVVFINFLLFSYACRLLFFFRVDCVWLLNFIYAMLLFLYSHLVCLSLSPSYCSLLDGVGLPAWKMLRYKSSFLIACVSYRVFVGMDMPKLSSLW